MLVRRILAALKPFLLIISIVIGLLLLLMYIAYQDIPAPGGKLMRKVAFTNVHVIDPGSNEVHPSRSILIEDGTIVDVVDQAASLPEGFALQDMAGAFVTAGFWDMHVHLPRLSEHYSGPMMVMHGVLYAREMSSDCFGSTCVFNRKIQENRALDNLVTQGSLLGPIVAERGSILVHGPKIANTEFSNGYRKAPTFSLAPQTTQDGLDMAAAFAKRGVDFVKPYDSLPLDAVRGLVRGSRANGLYFGGHVAKAMTLKQAIMVGQRTVEHARMLPLACSTYDGEFAGRYLDWLDSAETSETEPKLNTFLPEVLGSFDKDKCRELLDLWATSDTYYVPTHLTRRSDFLVHTGAFRTDERSLYVPQLLIKANWEGEETRNAEIYREYPDRYQQTISFYELGVRLSGDAFKAGVKLLVGTDSGDTLIYPGPSFHDEMQILADGGLAPNEILAAATIDAARFAGLEATHGSIEPGKAANLVFFEENPLVDIAHSQSINGVFYQSRFYNEGARNYVMNTVKSKARGIRHHLMFGWFLISRVLPSIPKYGFPGDDYAPARDSHYCRDH